MSREQICPFSAHTHDRLNCLFAVSDELTLLNCFGGCITALIGGQFSYPSSSVSAK